jgi:hypothetical protein
VNRACRRDRRLRFESDPSKTGRMRTTLQTPMAKDSQRIPESERDGKRSSGEHEHAEETHHERIIIFSAASTGEGRRYGSAVEKPELKTGNLKVSCDGTSMVDRTKGRTMNLEATRASDMLDADWLITNGGRDFHFRRLRSCDFNVTSTCSASTMHPHNLGDTLEDSITPQIRLYKRLTLREARNPRRRQGSALVAVSISTLRMRLYAFLGLWVIDVVTAI